MMRFGKWRYGLAAAVAAIALAAPSPIRPGSPAAGGSDGDPITVEVTHPARGTVLRRLEVTASLEPWEEAVLYAKASGFLKSIRVDRGDLVRRGDVLAVLDIPEMADEQRQLLARREQAEAEVLKAAAEVDLHELTLGRLEAIEAEEAGATTRQEIDLARGRLEAARAALRAAESSLGVMRADLARLETLILYARIPAPFDGIITERYVDPGALVTAGTASRPTPVLRIVDASRLRAMVDVPETEVRHVRKGRAARLRVDAYPERLFEGEVSRYSRALDPMTRTMRTEVLIENPDGTLTPGMFGRLSLDLERREDVLTLSPAGLHVEQDARYVYVADNGHARRVEILCGLDDGNSIEIRSGLTGDESIIVRASGPLVDGVPVIVAAPQGAAPGDAP